MFSWLTFADTSVPLSNQVGAVRLHRSNASMDCTGVLTDSDSSDLISLVLR